MTTKRASQSETVVPIGGRLCQRALKDGYIWVGVMHLPEDFVPVEGSVYALVQNEHRLVLVREPAAGGIPPDYQSYGVGDLLTQRIWNKTLDSNALTVRFLGAFPEDNVWGVYGASPYHLEPDAPSHTWCDIDNRGWLKTIEAPFDAFGEGIGSLLSAHPVWPDKSGALHTLSQLQTPYRAHFHTYHKMLVKAASDDAYREALPGLLAKNPLLRNLQIGRIDKDFCEYLAKLDQRGLLVADAPQSAEVYAHRNQVSSQIMRELMDLDEMTHTRRMRP